MRCPICKKPIETERDKNPAAPFCSARCRGVDLGRWLGEQYSIPAVEQDLSPDDPSLAAPPSPRVN